jgi:hypothetical protein
MEFGPFIVCRFTPVGDLRLLNLHDGCKGAGSSEKTRTTQQLVWTLGLSGQQAFMRRVLAKREKKASHRAKKGWL